MRNVSVSAGMLVGDDVPAGFQPIPASDRGTLQCAVKPSIMIGCVNDPPEYRPVFVRKIRQLSGLVVIEYLVYDPCDQPCHFPPQQGYPSMTPWGMTGLARREKL